MADGADQISAPPPGAALLDAVAKMQPVRTRVPLRTLVLVLAVGLVWPVIAVLRQTRADLPYLPLAWVVTMALVWTAGVVAPLWAAILPRRGEVLADGTRAARMAAACASLLVLLGLVATVDSPETSIPADFAAAWWHCASFGLRVAIPVLAVSALVLRRLYPAGSWRVAAALGAAGGALGGLTLHFICSYGGGLHVGLAHAGGVVLSALAGALVLPIFLRG
jgi:hypothetical protein